IATLGHSIQESSLTSLGSYMMDLTFWLQVMVLFSTFVLAVISISDSLNTLLMERKDEFNMYYLIGWTRGRIKTHLLKEVGIWSVISILTGLILSSISLYVLKVSVLWVLTGLLITMTLFLVMIFLIVLTRRI
ncbi:FtsX-like permease family protein, partial [Melghiribacillus thermohalophilus]